MSLPHSTGQFFTIPDFPAVCPFPLTVNANRDPHGRLSNEWINAFGVFPNPSHEKAVKAMNFGLLTAMCYPDADEQRFRIICDFIHALFAFDDLTDEGALFKDSDATKRAADIVMNALWHPYTYETGFKVGKVFACFWRRAMRMDINPGAARRFIETTDLYLQAVHEQVVRRAEDQVYDIEGFIKLRRDTGAVKMCFAMGEFGSNLRIPDEVFEHPSMRVLEDAANDVIILCNDIFSFNNEQAQDDAMNLVQVARRDKGLDIQNAIDFVGDLIASRIQLYQTTKRSFPKWGDVVDKEVLGYFKVFENWMIGSIHWSLQSKRYFGDKVEEVKTTRRVELLPRLAPTGQTYIPDLQ
ncbi:hypothetical protein FRB99_007176 [Tulasnella sp. 403]|nr:hypothetical protein FRB99_007176 [Tulasnella sp. 403]